MRPRSPWQVADLAVALVPHSVEPTHPGDGFDRRPGRAEIRCPGTNPTENRTLRNSLVRGAVHHDMGKLIGGTECNGRPVFRPDADGTCHVSAHSAVTVRHPLLDACILRVLSALRFQGLAPCRSNAAATLPEDEDGFVRTDPTGADRAALHLVTVERSAADLEPCCRSVLSTGSAGNPGSGGSQAGSNGKRFRGG
ncbi:MAG: hypothetical protein F4213_18270 [Boseongicola sp. SB0677_bin_26]|nr:hypothetical protein [Boseongicola sp. SB0665_bin_10]MYG27939.1 hypothetical protein [Boseongicola sp. SB0677_bin_26]